MKNMYYPMREVYRRQVLNVGEIALYEFEVRDSRDIATITTTVASQSVGKREPRNILRLWSNLLIKGHESPFEFVSWIEGGKRKTLRHNIPESEKIDFDGIYTFWLRVPIFVARQIMRHRAFSYMELSRRYVTDKKSKFEFYYPKKSLFLKTYYFLSKLLYKWLRRNLPAELARIVLPVSLYTEFWMQGDFYAWVNFFLYRTHADAQEETRLIAIEMLKAILSYDKGFGKRALDFLKNDFVEENPYFTEARKRYVSTFELLLRSLEALNNERIVETM